jgi:thiamine-phosphate pyrophosphorylase
MQGLYLVTPNWDDTDRLLDLTRTGAGRRRGAGPVPPQGRRPRAAAEQATALLALCRRHGVPLIINDHVDLCLNSSMPTACTWAAPMPVARSRAALGAGKIVGASCYGDWRWRWRAAAGASYVAFGGFYPSR